MDIVETVKIVEIVETAETAETVETLETAEKRVPASQVQPGAAIVISAMLHSCPDFWSDPQLSPFGHIYLISVT